MLCPVLEAPTFVTGFDHLTMMREPVEKSRCHLRVTEDGRPFTECQIGGDDDRCSFVELIDEMEQNLASANFCNSARETIVPLLPNPHPLGQPIWPC